MTRWRLFWRRYAAYRHYTYYPVLGRARGRGYGWREALRCALWRAYGGRLDPRSESRRRVDRLIRTSREIDRRNPPPEGWIAYYARREREGE